MKRALATLISVLLIASPALAVVQQDDEQYIHLKKRAHVSSGGSAPSTPTYISSVGEASQEGYPNGYATPEVNKFYFWTTQAPATGDCMLVYVTNSGSSAIGGLAATDAAGNTFTAITSSVDAADGGEIALLAAPITSAGSGADKVTISWTGETDYVEAGYLLEAGVSTSSCTSPDQTWTNSDSSTGTSITAGSGTKTTSASGDLLLMCAIGTTSQDMSYTPGSQSNITWKLVPGTPQYTFPSTCQYGTYNSTAAINPTMSISAANTYAAFAVAIKAGSSGSAAPSNKYVSAIAHWDVSGWTGNNGGTVTEQMAVQGNALVITGSSYCGGANGPGYYITAISDSQSGTWTQATGSPVYYSGECPASGTSYIWYRIGVTPTSTLTVTLTMNSVTVSGNEPDTALLAYDCQNLTGFDTSSTATGNQTSSGTLSTASLTPTNPNELIITVQSEDFYGVNGVTGTFTNFESGSWINGSGADQCNASYTPPNIPDECNGSAWVTYGSTGAITAQYASTGIAAAYWASVIAAFD